MKKYIIVFILSLFTLLVAGCNKTEKVDVVTTSYVAYDVAKNIIQDKLKVKSLIKPGEDMHNKTMSISDLVLINNSKLIIYTSIFFDNKLISQEDFKKHPNKISLFKLVYPEIDEDHLDHHHEEEHHHEHHHEEEHHHEHHHEEEHHHEHHHEAHDYIHFFTSLNNLVKIIEEVKKHIVILDKENEDFYNSNAINYINNINNEKEKFLNYLKGKTNREVFFLGHDSFGLFAKEFNITITSFHEDIKPDAMTKPEEYTNFIKKLKEVNPLYLFIPELDEKSNLKEAIKNDYKIDNNNFLELHSFHNISKEDFNKNITILDLIRRNFKNLQMEIIK